MPIVFVPSRPKSPAPDPSAFSNRTRNWFGGICSLATLFPGALIASATAAAVQPPLPELRPDLTAAPPATAIKVDPEQPPLPFEPEMTIALCQTALGDRFADFTPIEPIREAIVCGHPNPIRLESLGSEKIILMPAATSNCSMAGALTRWLEEFVQPSAEQNLGEPVTALRNAASYVCRSRNNVPGARLSEHATTNALDVSAFQLASGRWISVSEFWTGDSPESQFLNQIHDQACEEFTTVLGPNANASHQDHFHLDLGRHGSTGTYRVCE